MHTPSGPDKSGEAPGQAHEHADEQSEFEARRKRFAPDYADERRFMVIRRPDGTVIPPPDQAR